MNDNTSKNRKQNYYKDGKERRARQTNPLSYPLASDINSAIELVGN